MSSRNSIFSVCWIEDRLLGSCFCSAESTSVVAASVVGVLGASAPEAELDPFPVRWGGVLGSLEDLRRAGLSQGVTDL